MLRIWRAHPQFTTAQIAAAAGCHRQTVRKHLLRLSDRSVRRVATACGADIAAMADDTTAGSAARLAVVWSRWDRNTMERSWAAADTALPAPTLRRLAFDSDGGVRRAVAANPATPVRVVEMLATSDREPFVCLAAIRSRRCSPQTVAAAAATGRPGLRLEPFAEQAACPPSALRHIAGQRIDDQSVAAAVANRNCPADVVAVAAANTTMLHRHGAARNPNCPPDLLTELAADSHHDVRVAAVANPACPAAAVEHAAGDNVNRKRRRAAAANPACPPATIAQLADDHHDVRVAAVANPACPAATVGHAADHGDQSARAAAVSNPNIPPALLARVAANDPSPAVRVAAAGNTTCPVALLERLGGDVRFEVRAAAARNLRCPPELLARLAADPHQLVAVAAAGNTSTPRDVLHRLARRSRRAQFGAAGEPARRNIARRSTPR